ncbi:hypothetical protein CVT26_012431 [Gymnopilus dilepis]|uniref:Tc1-like transposase DDE domain-containing protein n=1 Tax=Gymnopilus dilepis TaxID=231916 RepID=A0A409YW89_9AGAR|nr:hypothetical protein CVT26_012431 [Gymnopilus dilepis]
MTDIPYSTAKTLWHKYQETGSTKNRPRSGRPKKVTERLERALIRNAVKERRKPFRELGNAMPGNLSEGTIRNVLDEHGYHRRIARKVPYLTDDHKRKRKHWAELYRRFRKRQWRKPIWSDECYIYLGDSRGKVYVTRLAEEEYNENCLVPKFKQSSLRVMIWGCIAKGKKGPLVVLEYPGGKGGGMNSERYITQVLEGALKPFFQELKQARRGPIFQQDGAASHRSKETLKWLSDHGIPLMDHPPNSPDLSPIEPVWHELKTIIRARPHPPTSAPELIQAVKDAWEMLPISVIDKYIDSMPERVQAVLDADGGHTGF